MHSDRVPPQNIEAERALLGACMLNPDRFTDAAAILGKMGGNAFYVEAHMFLWRAIEELHDARQSIDPITIIQNLQKRKTLERAGGAPYIAELGGVVPTTAHIEQYARIVRDAGVLRYIIDGCTRLVGMAYDSQDAGPTVDKLQTLASNIAGMRFEGHEIVSASTALASVVSRIERITSDDGDGTMETGILSLDDLVYGLKKGELVIIAGRPSAGKTAFGLAIASYTASRKEQACLYFSLEMGHDQLYMRIASAHTGISLEEEARKKYLAGSKAVKAAEQAAEELATLRLDVDDSGTISVYEVRSKVKKWMSGLPKGTNVLIVFDYLQLINIPGETRSRQQDLGKVTRAMKAMARELDIPMVVLCQLRREFEQEKSAMRGLPHLRESGDIEQDADMVICLRKMGDDEWDKAGLPKPAHDRVYVDVGVCKNRNGATGPLTLAYDLKTQTYSRVHRERRDDDAAHAGARLPYKDDLPEWSDDHDEPF